MLVISATQKIPETHQSCMGAPNCPTCHLFEENGGPCRGCAKGNRQRSCDTQCGTCSGHYMKEAPAICCKSPFKDLLLKPVDRKYEFTGQQPIKLKNKAILVVIGGRSSVIKDQSPYSKDFDAIAVNLRHVWSEGGGFFSRDMKDYMMIPKEKKLILTTSMYDDVLDKAWRLDLFEGFDEVGFDYWQPLLFSVYEIDGRMNQYWNHKRMQYSLWRSKAHFCDQPLPPEGFNEQMSEDYRAMVSKVPNIVFNKAMADNSETSLRKFYAEVKKVHEMVPKEATFWLMGVGNQAAIRVALAAAPGRDIYPMTAAPWIGAHKGRMFTVDGKAEPARHLDKKEVIFKSQENFIKLVKNCYDKTGVAPVVVKGAKTRSVATKSI